MALTHNFFVGRVYVWLIFTHTNQSVGICEKNEHLENMNKASFVLFLNGA